MLSVGLFISHSRLAPQQTTKDLFLPGNLPSSQILFLWMIHARLLAEQLALGSFKIHKPTEYSLGVSGFEKTMLYFSPLPWLIFNSECGTYLTSTVVIYLLSSIFNSQVNRTCIHLHNQALLAESPILLLHCVFPTCAVTLKASQSTFVVCFSSTFIFYLLVVSCVFSGTMCLNFRSKLFFYL